MMPGRLVVERALAETLRVSTVVLDHWRSIGCLDDYSQLSSEAGQYRFYAHSSVDAFMQKGMLRQRQPAFTLAELLAYEYEAGSASLLTLAETAAQLGLAVHTVWHYIKRGFLPAFTLACQSQEESDWQQLLRIPVAGLAKFITDTSPNHSIRAVFAAKILGVNRHMITQLMRAGRLEEVKVRGHLDEAYVSRASLVTLLTELLGGDDAEAWIAMRQKYGYEPLLTKYQVVGKYHIGHHRLARVLRNGELPYIETPDGTVRKQGRIPLHALHAWARNRRQQPAVLASWFGCSPEDAAAWTTAGMWCNIRQGFQFGNQTFAEKDLEFDIEEVMAVLNEK